MTYEEEEALALWQQHKGDPILADTLVYECMERSEVIAVKEAVRDAMREESEMTTDEGWLAKIIRDIEELPGDDGIDVIIVCLDDLIERARAGKVDKYAAQQIHSRAEQIFAAVALPQLKGAA